MTVRPNYEQAVAHAVNQLRGNLDPQLTYHNLWHTENDVIPAALRLADASGIAEDDMILLRVAAAYHDVGFVYTTEGHEIASAREAAQTLPQFGFSDRQIERVMGLIMATRLPQSPRNLLEEILADADLDVLGRDDFLIRNRQLRQEMANYGQSMTDREWLHFQLEFLQEHTYFTAAARACRVDKKLAHYQAIQVEFEKLVS
ncbi:MAG: HD domain-containing protein [Ardenticatenaceae bacterium]|nr:HD domain-containing protein [Anaerolineales bacterium]MCB8923705.1 HD domain-containing protein [Ardenticatenaceae bacterium]